MIKPLVKLKDSEPDTRPTLGFLLGGLDRALVRELFRRLAHASYDDLTPAHANIFRCVDREGTRLTTIAERAQITKQSVGYLVDTLERHGYVERVPDPLDRRAKIVRLTERGRENERLAIAFIEEIEKEWAALIGGDQAMSQLRELLTRLVEKLGEIDGTEPD